MAFRFVSMAGVSVEPAAVLMYASGVVHAGGAVEFQRTNTTTAQGFIAPAASTTTGTLLFGICLDGAQGNSDTLVRVIPICQGQIWEADCVSAISTVQIGKKQQLYNDTLLNNTSYDQSGQTGVFVVWNVDGLTTGSGKVLGEFVRLSAAPQNTTVYF